MLYLNINGQLCLVEICERKKDYWWNHLSQIQLTPPTHEPIMCELTNELVGEGFTTEWNTRLRPSIPTLRHHSSYFSLQDYQQPSARRIRKGKSLKRIYLEVDLLFTQKLPPHSKSIQFIQMNGRSSSFHTNPKRPHSLYRITSLKKEVRITK